MFSKYICVKTQFISQHRWKDAPDEVAFLRNYHRHIFYVDVQIPVAHSDREKEFFMVKKRLNNYIADKWANTKFEASCEMIAEDIIKNFLIPYYGDTEYFAKVSEDKENAGLTIYTPPIAV